MPTNTPIDNFAKNFGIMIIVSSKLEYHIIKMIEKSDYLSKKYSNLKKKDFYNVLRFLEDENFGVEWQCFINKANEIRDMRNKIGHGLMVLHSDHIEVIESLYKNPKSSTIDIHYIKKLIDECEQINTQLYNSIMVLCNDNERRYSKLPILKVPNVT